jgi:DNA-binding NtrC family response regulator
VAVDCGAIPENLLENEFFGHRKGAYSDAREDRDGLAQLADGGTLFLDEIGELPLPMQAKLLRFMQTREFRRLGDTRTTSADVRFVAATNRDLQACVAQGTFRDDLYYRINVISLRLPPLRERAADIPALAVGFVHKYAKEFESPALSIARDAIDDLCRRPWPGNVRELENVIQRAVAMATTAVLGLSAFAGAGDADLVPAPHAQPVSGIPVEGALPGGFHEAKQAVIDRFERDYAADLIRRHAGNLSAAAREAGLDRKSLSRLLARHELEVATILES